MKLFNKIFYTLGIVNFWYDIYYFCIRNNGWYYHCYCYYYRLNRYSATSNILRTSNRYLEYLNVLKIKLLCQMFIFDARYTKSYGYINSLASNYSHNNRIIFEIGHTKTTHERWYFNSYIWQTNQFTTSYSMINISVSCQCPRKT